MTGRMRKLRPAEPADIQAVQLLLRRENLPLEGVAEHIEDFLVAEQEGSIVGCAGVERYGDAALLRSVAVAPEHRGQGLGDRLVRELIGRASRQGLRSIFLLTTTAEQYFARRGFKRVARDRVNPELFDSAEFCGACPTTAVCMRLQIVQH